MCRQVTLPLSAYVCVAIKHSTKINFVVRNDRGCFLVIASRICSIALSVENSQTLNKVEL